MCAKVHSWHGYENHDRECSVEILIFLSQTIVFDDYWEANDNREPAVSTGVAVLLGAVESDRLDVFMRPEGSGVGVEGFEKTGEVCVKKEEHDSDKCPVLVSHNDHDDEGA